MGTGTARVGQRASLALVAAALVAAPADAVHAGDVPKAPAREALTSLEAGELSRSEAVVLAHVRLLVPGRAGAPTLARATIERALKGVATGEVTLFVGGPRSADRPTDRPLDPWFTGAALGEQGGRYVLFLRTTRQGSGWSLEGLFGADDEEGREKADVLGEEIRLAAEPDAGLRREKTIAHLLRLVEAERPWSRLHGARELAWIAGSIRGALDEAALQKIEALLGRSSERGVRTALALAIDRVEPGRSTRPPPPSAAEGRPVAGIPPSPVEGPAVGPPPQPVPEPPPVRASDVPAAPEAPPTAPSAEVLRLRAALAAADGPAARIDALTAIARAGKASVAEDLVGALSDRDATVRERAAVLLGDVFARDALPRVIARFPCEDDVAVREAIVRAAGLLGDETTVAWVIERGSDPMLFRAACYALARIRTPNAIERLTAWRERAAAAVPRDDATVSFVDYLRGRTFEEAERIAGHPVGPRSTSRKAVEAPPGAPAVREDAGTR